MVGETWLCNKKNKTKFLCRNRVMNFFVEKARVLNWQLAKNRIDNANKQEKFTITGKLYGLLALMLDPVLTHSHAN